LNILYESQELAHGARLLSFTIFSGQEKIATIGFRKISRKGIFFLFLYSHFATSLAALSAFLFQPDLRGFITT
jgi:hypothetical protein